MHDLRDGPVSLIKLGSYVNASSVQQAEMTEGGQTRAGKRMNECFYKKNSRWVLEISLRDQVNLKCLSLLWLRKWLRGTVLSHKDIIAPIDISIFRETIAKFHRYLGHRHSRITWIAREKREARSDKHARDTLPVDTRDRARVRDLACIRGRTDSPRRQGGRCGLTRCLTRGRGRNGPSDAHTAPTYPVLGWVLPRRLRILRQPAASGVSRHHCGPAWSRLMTYSASTVQRCAL